MQVMKEGAIKVDKEDRQRHLEPAGRIWPMGNSKTGTESIRQAVSLRLARDRNGTHDFSQLATECFAVEAGKVVGQRGCFSRRHEISWSEP
jgi:hypothetical protein